MQFNDCLEIIFVIGNFYMYSTMLSTNIYDVLIIQVANRKKEKQLISNNYTKHTYMYKCRGIKV